MIFSFNIFPLIREWCSIDKHTVNKVFGIFENMANSDETDVLKVLDFSVLEPIADMDDSDRSIIEKYMKAETIDQYQYIRDHMFR